MTTDSLKGDGTGERPCPLGCSGAVRCLCESEVFEGVRVRVCEKCGFVFGDPIPDGTALEEYYRREYYSGFLHRRWALPLRLRMADRRAGRQMAFVTPYVGSSPSVLEIGCGFGSLLRRMRQAGWDVSGIEASEAAAEYARGVYGLDVVRGSLETLAEERRFSLVVLSHVFEHFGDIDWAARRIRDLLRPGGLAFLELPNADGRIYQGGYGRVPDLYFFNPRNAGSFFQKHGFRVVAMRTVFLPQAPELAQRLLPGAIADIWNGVWGIGSQLVLRRKEKCADAGGDWIRLLLAREA